MSFSSDKVDRATQGLAAQDAGGPKPSTFPSLQHPAQTKNLDKENTVVVRNFACI